MLPRLRFSRPVSHHWPVPSRFTSSVIRLLTLTLVLRRDGDSNPGAAQHDVHRFQRCSSTDPVPLLSLFGVGRKSPTILGVGRRSTRCARRRVPSCVAGLHGWGMPPALGLLHQGSTSPELALLPGPMLPVAASQPVDGLDVALGLVDPLHLDSRRELTDAEHAPC